MNPKTGYHTSNYWWRWKLENDAECQYFRRFRHSIQRILVCDRNVFHKDSLLGQLKRVVKLPVSRKYFSFKDSILSFFYCRSSSLRGGVYRPRKAGDLGFLGSAFIRLQAVLYLSASFNLPRSFYQVLARVASSRQGKVPPHCYKFLNLIRKRILECIKNACRSINLLIILSGAAFWSRFSTLMFYSGQ